MKPKQEVWKDITTLSPYEFDGDPDEVLKNIADKINSYKRSYKEYSKFRLHSDVKWNRDCNCEDIYLQGFRLETDAEYQARIKTEDEQQKQQDEYARKQYEQLKKRFEGNNE